MGIYDALGVKTLINASATLTVLGGSLMPPEVLAAMAEASQAFVDIHDLHLKVGQRLAELTHNEAALVCSGAAGGIMLAAAACVTGADASLAQRFPALDGLPNEILVQRRHRNEFEYQIAQIGIRVVEFGSEAGASRDDLIRAITPQTAGIFWFQGIMTGPDDLALEDVITIAHEHGLPVIVDAAAQLPPPENLWRFTEMGADLAIFSGGKDLCGPQSSGLIVGRSDLVAACRMYASPHDGIGRPMKVGKEEILGLLAAVERYLKLDHAARERYCEATMRLWCDGLARIKGLIAERAFPNEARQPLPWCCIEVDAGALGISRDEIVARLLEGEPGVAVNMPPGCAANVFYMNPSTLQPDEEKLVLERLLDVLRWAPPI